ncbi:MAG: GTP cyclohydrolase II [Flavobacteriales bacterium]|nr:GTP cyclohydrolase II [Flavobacteriales bacterium]
MIQKLAETTLPTVHGNFIMLAYDSGKDDFPHVVLVNGDLSAHHPVDVRIHSECMTGDVFSSVRCDCGEQLDTSMHHFGQKGGILIYLRQEGRGIGLVNKMKAYNLQNEGLDTIKANHALGFHTDERNFEDAIEILHDLGVNRINLLTNNPEKIDAFTNSGIEVVERIAIEIRPREENAAYLKTKRSGMGHFFSSLELGED